MSQMDIMDTQIVVQVIHLLYMDTINIDIYGHLVLMMR